MRATGVGRRWVETWTRLGYLPERHRMEPRPGMPAAFRDYLAQRWNQGYRRVKDLLKEVREQGYIRCYSALAELLSPWRTIPPVPSPTHTVVTTPAAPPSRRLPPQVAAGLLAKHPGEFTGLQAQTVATLKGNNPQIDAFRRFLLRFRGLLRGSSKAKLQQWMKDVEDSGFTRLERFVQVLRRDGRAVENAVTMPWSNGQVEGQINKLKTLKRRCTGAAVPSYCALAYCLHPHRKLAPNLRQIRIQCRAAELDQGERRCRESNCQWDAGKARAGSGIGNAPDSGKQAPGQQRIHHVLDYGLPLFDNGRQVELLVGFDNHLQMAGGFRDAGIAMREVLRQQLPQQVFKRHPAMMPSACCD